MSRLSGQLCSKEAKRLCYISWRLAGSHMTGFWSLTRLAGSGFFLCVCLELIAGAAVFYVKALYLYLVVL